MTTHAKSFVWDSEAKTIMCETCRVEAIQKVSGHGFHCPTCEPNLVMAMIDALKKENQELKDTAEQKACDAAFYGFCVGNDHHQSIDEDINFLMNSGYEFEHCVKTFNDNYSDPDDRNYKFRPVDEDKEFGWTNCKIYCVQCDCDLRVANGSDWGGDSGECQCQGCL